MQRNRVAALELVLLNKPGGGAQTDLDDTNGAMVAVSSAPQQGRRVSSMERLGAAGRGMS